MAVVRMLTLSNGRGASHEDRSSSHTHTRKLITQYVLFMSAVCDKSNTYHQLTYAPCAAAKLTFSEETLCFSLTG